MTWSFAHKSPASVISTHILTRRMTAAFSSKLSASLHFNSHPHKEDDFHGVPEGCRCHISTHILTRRMTGSGNGCHAIILISTHILTRRMTGHIPTTPPMFEISTHILTRRMTRTGRVRLTRSYFNSHPHKEDDSNFKQKQSI